MADVPASNDNALRPLMGIRYLAAVSVVLTHLEWLPFSSAVPLFFVLSGFILTYKYARTDEGLTVDVRTFWIARLTRLYPAHLLALLLLIGLHLHDGYSFMDGLGSLVASVLMVNGWNPRLVVTWNIPSWTNTCEMFFYICFPLLVPLALRLRSRHALLIAMGITWIAGLAMTHAIEGLRPHTSYVIDWWLWLAKFNPVLHLPEFVIGMLLGRWYGEWGGRDDARRGAMWSGGAFVLAVAVTLRPDIITRAEYLYIHNTLLAPVFAAGLWGLTLGGGLARILSTPLLVRLGNASYAIYILQDPVFTAARMALGVQCFVEHPALVPVMVVLLTLVGLGVHHLIEEPVLTKLRPRLDALVPGRARSMGVARRESVVALFLTALAVLWVSLLPQHRTGLKTSRLESTLSSVGAPRVGWVEGGDERYLVHYDDRVLDTRFELFRGNRDLSLVLAPRWWGDSDFPRYIDAEERDDIVLWGRAGTPLPPRYQITARTVFGNRLHPSVRERGLYPPEPLPSGDTFRWTNGEAVLEVPAPDGFVAHRLEIRLAASAPQRLEVRVGGHIVRSALTGGLDETIVVPFPPAPCCGMQRIELRTPAWVPHERDPASGDTRLLGVPVKGLRLLP